MAVIRSEIGVGVSEKEVFKRLFSSNESSADVLFIDEARKVLGKCNLNQTNNLFSWPMDPNSEIIDNVKKLIVDYRYDNNFEDQLFTQLKKIFLISAEESVSISESVSLVSHQFEVNSATGKSHTYGLHMGAMFKAERHGSGLTISAFIYTQISRIYAPTCFPNLRLLICKYVKEGLDHDSLSHFQNCKIPPKDWAERVFGTKINRTTRLTNECLVNRSLDHDKQSPMGGTKNQWTKNTSKSRVYSGNAGKSSSMHQVGPPHDFAGCFQNCINMQKTIKNSSNKYFQSSSQLTNALGKNGTTTQPFPLCCSSC
jgi:hypothetical protein